MISEFLSNTTLISFSPADWTSENFLDIQAINLTERPGFVTWLNTYGLHHLDEFQQVILQNDFDDFLIKLLMEDEHPNKVIELDGILFVAITVLKTDSPDLETEQMYFLVRKECIWSIQEKHGDYFGWIRERIRSNKGIVRKKKADYLLYLLIESIVDNYYMAFEKLAKLHAEKLDPITIKPTPEFTASIEHHRSELFQIKKAGTSLRDTINKLIKANVPGLKSKYYYELREQANQLLSDVEFELQELDSKINLIFSIQGHRLNEVMKTLTIFSVIFIPLTFLTGLYGMNFEYIPGLHNKNGYYVVIGIMAAITLMSLFFVRLKKWF